MAHSLSFPFSLSISYPLSDSPSKADIRRKNDPNKAVAIKKLALKQYQLRWALTHLQKFQETGEMAKIEKKYKREMAKAKEEKEENGRYAEGQ